MRIRSLSPLALIIGAALPGLAQASSDDTCYPTWSPLKNSLDVCNNFAFLSPGNDSRVNLRLLLADRKALQLTPNPVSAEEVSVGYGPVPFQVSRLDPSAIEDEQGDHSTTAQLGQLLEKLGIRRDNVDTAGDAFLQGEGSRCRSNSDDSATAFVEQLLATPSLTAAERQSLARARMQLLDTCTWEAQNQARLLPSDIESAQGKAFVTYLRAASDFYSGRFVDAEQGFASLTADPQPWLKEVATYMIARTRLNAAQQGAFDEYGTRKENLDPAPYAGVGKSLQDYLGAYPQGLYAASAKGLMRRVHWLAGETRKLADDYAWQLTQAPDEQRNVALDDLIQETDNKLLMNSPGPLSTPLLAAVNDLMSMRPDGQFKLTGEQLLAQQSLFAEQPALFAEQPALFAYLQAAFALFVEDKPGDALKRLPEDMPDSLDYLAFSQQTLRGLALEANHDLPAAQALWLKLLPRVTQPLQRDQVELTLAMNYERSGQVNAVFASDSPIQSAQVRLILLDKVADAPLLRQQSKQGISDTEKATAQFVLLYKDLLRGQYADFAEDLKALPDHPGDLQLGASLGYVYSPGQTLQLFRWNGEKAESGYLCPSIGETAAALQAVAQDPKALNCLGEFILRNGLDSMPLDQRPDADELGGSEPGLKGEVFSRHSGYQTVIADTKASRDDRAYALFRAINCYGPSGYNSCGGKEVAQSVRKGWFKQLKTTYGATTWGKSLQYYW